ncbi:TonB-dependent receptor [Fibrella aquatilis]|uniref:TonB-dependent receptor n=1 Tax=Fibrella aquatilis TaxID=2817059 RepID=A0A939G486_9BACT|nr:TonB-dependent receptor [Fibrella aquatilis]MBO0931591.1 TonB-dependent receptor [Fibrella aquatilis]
MIRHLYVCVLLCLAVGQLQAQSKKIVQSLTGYIRHATTKEPIVGATIFIQSSRIGTTTGKDGFFVIPLEEGSYPIRISHVGYLSQTMTVNVNKLTLINVELVEDTQYLEEVVVQTEAPDKNVRKVELGVTQLSIKNIRRIPAFMGEVDVVRSLLLLPGVTSVGEGATGINVRGGSIDQNLVLLDDAPLFNTSHLLGFFSVFNPDVVRDVTLHRGGIAPAFGGRASSVLDIKIKEPETEKWSAYGGIGIVSNRAGVEGPIIKKKLTMLAATRVSYNDFLFKLGPASISGTRANFYDLTTKLKWQASEKHTITGTGYFGRDVFRLASDSLSSVEINSSSTQFDYQSLAGTVRWNYFINPQLNLNTTAVWSQYRSETSAPDSANQFSLVAEVRHKQIKSDLTIALNERHAAQVGLSAIDYYVQPNALTPGRFSNALPFALPTERAYELAAYVQDEWKLSEATSLLAGLRYSLFLNDGPTTLRNYSPELPRLPGTATSLTPYAAGTIYHTYGGLEPRLALRMTIGEGKSIKVGYNRMRQYIHLVSNTTAALPTSRWLLSNPNIKPQIADQLSVGYFANGKQNEYEASAEVYYKTLTNAIDYRDGANLQRNPAPETDLLQGTGQAYGLEMLVRKNKGAWTGWVSYTFSRTLLTMNGRFSDEQVNNGLAYPANFDKPHTLNATATYRPSLRFSMSFNFTYSTGRPVTQPYGRARINNVVVPIYVNRNQERIPDYHRLDFSMLFEQDPAKKRKVQQSWNFAIYNVYAHKNAYSVFYRYDPRQFEDAFKLSIFGTAFPSLTYNVRF